MYNVSNVLPKEGNGYHCEMGGHITADAYSICNFFTIITQNQGYKALETCKEGPIPLEIK